MRNVSDKIRENQDTAFVLSKFLLKSAIYEIMQKNLATYDNIIQCMCFELWIAKATDTH